MLDFETTIHIFNKLSRFEGVRIAPIGDFVSANHSKAPIQGYGNLSITLSKQSYDYVTLPTARFHRNSNKWQGLLSGCYY